MAAQHDRFDFVPVPVVEEPAIEADTTVSQQPANVVALNRVMVIVGLVVVSGIIAGIYAIAPTVVKGPLGGLAEMNYSRFIWVTDRPWLIAATAIILAAVIVGIIARYDERFRSDIVGLGRTLVQPIGWSARQVRAHAKIVVLSAVGIALLGLVYVGVQRKRVANHELLTALVAEQKAFSGLRTDWMACAATSQGVEATNGALRLVRQGSSSGKWATSTITGGNWTHIGGSPDGDVWLTNETGAAKAAHYVSGGCTQYPMPSASNALAISGVSTTDAWAVGVGGMIAHWNGSDWSSVASPASVDLKAVTAISASNAFALDGSEMMIHYDGNKWRVIGDRVLRGVGLNCIVADGSGGVYVGGTDKTVCPVVLQVTADLVCKRLGTISSYNGCVFSLSATAGSVIATGFVTGAPFTAQWNGAGWTDLGVPAAAPSLTSVRMAAASDTNVWVAQAYAGGVTYFHWDGHAWAKVVRPSGLGVPYDIRSVGKDYWVATSTDKVDKFTAKEVAVPKYQDAGVLEVRLLDPKWRRGVIVVADLPVGTDVVTKYSDDGNVWTDDPSGQTGPLHVRVMPKTSNQLVTPTLFKIKPAS